MKHFYVFLFLIFTCANITIAKEAMEWKSLLAQCPPDVESAIVVQVPYDQTGFLIEGVMEMLGEEIWTSESPTAPPPAPIQKTKTKIPRALLNFPEIVQVQREQWMMLRLRDGLEITLMCG